MSARSVCSGSRPCRYHSLRAISAPFNRPATRTLMPLQPKRSAESTALRIARRNATRFSSCSAIDSDRADARALQFFLQLLAELHVFVKQVGVVLVRVPPRLVRLVVAQPESVRMRLLSHYFFPFFGGACFPVNALRTRRAVPRTPFCASASASIAATRCAAAT